MNLNVAESIAAASKLTPGVTGMLIVACLLAFTMWDSRSSTERLLEGLHDISASMHHLADVMEQYDHERSDASEQARALLEEIRRISSVTCSHIANGTTEARWACLGGER